MRRFPKFLYVKEGQDGNMTFYITSTKPEDIAEEPGCPVKIALYERKKTGVITNQVVVTFDK